MGTDVNAPSRGNRFFGAAGMLMALCCLAGPASKAC
jgi:hypothetical protein